MATATRSSSTDSDPTAPEPDDERHPLDADLEILEATIDALTKAATLGALGAEDQVAARSELMGRLASQPAVMSRHLFELGLDHLRIALGSADIKPDPKDRRFGDSWFADNPLFRRLAQAHLANERRLTEIIDDLELDETTKLQVEFLAGIITSSLAPTNHLMGNPSALKEAWRSRGRSLVRGTRHLLDDLVHNGAMPAMVDREPFRAGETIAATPGAVVHRHELFELLHYRPTTDQVHERPVVVVPPQINKYYVLDLAPGRSLAEHLVAQGQQVFMISWRNPGPEHRAWNLDTYVDAVSDAVDVARTVTTADDVNLLGVCAGGITSSALAGYLAATDDPRLNTLTLLVTILDWATPSTMGAMLNPATVQLMRAQTALTGVLSGQELSRTFAWLRPNDLVWNYWVNNYLHGRKPPAFDVLAWNVDSTNLPAGLHQDFLAIAADNELTRPGSLTVKGVPIDLGAVEVENYVVGAVTDHITPWKACYESVALLGGPSTFVLSSQGHIQALVNPSGNPKGSFHTNPAADEIGVDPDTWLEGASTSAGSWWDNWTEWLAPRAGKLVDAPAELGHPDHPVLAPAPGDYVLD